MRAYTLLLYRSIFFSDNFAKVMELVLRLAQLEEENSRRVVVGRRLTAEQKVRACRNPCCSLRSFSLASNVSAPKNAETGN